MADTGQPTISAGCRALLKDPERFVTAYHVHDRSLQLETTRRQLATAADILLRMTGTHDEPAQRGVLLADDVGLGKTLIGAMVSCMIAASDSGRNVRILAPNATMGRKWAEEVQRVIDALRRCEISQNFQRLRVKREVVRLPPFSIQVASHHYAASDKRLAADLLLVDEAHRAKGDGSRFSKSLQSNGSKADKVLILTATPFSIEIEELNRMLSLVGGSAARTAVVKYKNALAALHSGNSARSVASSAQALVIAARNAVDAIRPWVIRHSVADVPLERAAIGTTQDWIVPVAKASEADLEALLRMDRAAALARRVDKSLAKLPNDPRYHVGWQYFNAERDRLGKDVTRVAGVSKHCIARHLDAIGEMRLSAKNHPKMVAVSSALIDVVHSGEKVLVFCHHIATAQELTAHLAEKLTRTEDPSIPGPSTFRDAWQQTIGHHGGDGRSTLANDVRRILIEWLCSPGISTQVWEWVRNDPHAHADLAAALRHVHPRHPKAHGTTASEANALLAEILSDTSTARVFQEAASLKRIDRLPGTTMSRAMGIIDPGSADADASFLVHNRSPDTIMAIFNSPFGPDILVATDRMSEGISLHRYCRHLVHYELDASPIRTVQRNGRVRRVGSWAAQIGEPIRYAYPAFAGTRDEQLVRIMRRRVESFSLLLGGVPEITLDDGMIGGDAWREEVLDIAKAELAGIGMRLCTVVAPDNGPA